MLYKTGIPRNSGFFVVISGTGGQKLRKAQVVNYGWNFAAFPCCRRDWGVLIYTENGQRRKLSFRSWQDPLGLMDLRLNGADPGIYQGLRHFSGISVFSAWIWCEKHFKSQCAAGRKLRTVSFSASLSWKRHRIQINRQNKKSFRRNAHDFRPTGHSYPGRDVV